MNPIFVLRDIWDDSKNEYNMNQLISATELFTTFKKYRANACGSF